MRSLSRPVLFLIGSVLAPVLLFAQNQPPADPLDALKTQEYWSVYDVLRDSGKLDSDTVTHSVLLHEPVKDRVVCLAARRSYLSRSRSDSSSQARHHRSPRRNRQPYGFVHRPFDFFPQSPAITLPAAP
jgi:hypothetical protein